MTRINFLYKILLSSFSLSIFSEGIILPIYAIFVQKVGGDILDAGWAMAAFLITQGIFTILVHRRAWGQKERAILMVLGWCIWVVGIISYIFIANMLMLFVAQIITALGNAIADPIFDLELSDHTDKKAKEFEWGIFEGAQVIVQGVAAIIGAAVVNYWGFNVLIYVMIAAATVSFAGILVYVRLVRDSKKT